MSLPFAADIEVSDTFNSKFIGENKGDLILYTETAQQSILFGTTTGVSPTIRLSSSDVAVSKSIVPRSNGLCDLGTQGSAFSNLYSFNVDALTSVKTAGTVRLDASGVLSNVSVPSAATTVNIDATRITSGIVDNARLTTATVSNAGIVQLSDSIAASSSSTAATSLAVKTAYDLASAALPKTGGTLSEPLNGTVINASNVLQTGSITRLDATGVLSNVSIPAAATTVNIDGTRITSGTVDNARLPLATLAAPGIAQLSDSINSSSSSNAATPAAVKVAYDLANAALPKSGGTLAGLLTVPDLNVESTISISGVQRIDAFGVLSSVSVPSTATTVNIDASRITSGIVDTAQLPFGTTMARGIVQLSDSVATVDSGTAATTTAVKNAYDLANAALPKSGGTLTGSLFVPDIDVSNTLSLNGVQRIDANGFLDNVTIADTANVAIDASRLTSGLVDNARLAAANTQQAGIVQLSDASNVDNSALAATSTAVKGVYDYVTSTSLSLSNYITSVASNVSTQSTATVQSNGVVRIDENGVLSNVSAPADAATVNIDASRLTSGTLSNARLTLASTSAAGIVQLSDAINSSSSVTAATSAGLKVAYDLASNALPRSGGTITGALTLNGNLFIGNHVVPVSNVAYDLGTSNFRFRDLYLSGNTIDLGGATIKTQSNNAIVAGGVNLKSVATLNDYNSSIVASGVNNWITSAGVPDAVQWRSVCWSPELSMFVSVNSSASVSNVMTSSNGIAWTNRVTGTSNNWNSVCWAPEVSLFVAVGNSGTGNRVMTSPDGVNWTARTSAADNAWLSVCWAPEIPLFVATSSTGTGNRVMTSPDGITWTSRTSVADNNWNSVCWSPELYQFVSVAITGTNRVMTSPDGINWTARTASTTNNWTSVAWSPKLMMYAAVANTGVGNRVMTSPDGITWTSRTSPADNSWNSICWAPQLSAFVAVASTGTGNRLMSSTNGTTWTIRSSPADNSWSSVCWSPELGVLASVAIAGTNRTMVSSPVVVAPKNTLIANPAFLSMSSSNTLAVPNVAVSGNIIPTSSIAYDLGTSNMRFRDLYLSGNTIDLGGAKISTLNSNIILNGLNTKSIYPLEQYDVVRNMSWSLTPSANDAAQWQTVCWSPELSLFVAVNIAGSASAVMTSPNGISWTQRTTPNQRWSSVCWAPELMLFTAVATSGTGNRVMTSPDGVTWTSRTSAADNSWTSVCWAPEVTLFVAVSSDGTNRIMTSPDGNTWTLRTHPANYAWKFVCWAPEIYMFVSVATVAATNNIMTSSDGITWTLRNGPAAVPWNSVAWSPRLLMFTAVASSGTGNRVMTSPNGITWTSRVSAADNNWTSVTWSPNLACFVAVAASGTSNRVMTSSDGISWKLRTSAADIDWTCICWSPDLSVFVATSISGTNRVMITAPALPAPKSSLLANPAFLSLGSSNTLSVTNVNVSSNLQTNGITRIDATGALSNITILSTSSSVTIDASRLTTGTLSNAVVPSLDASKIATGTFGTALIPNLDASKVTTGTFGTSFIPNLDAGKITTGTFTSNQIPSLDASKIATGTLASARLPAASTSASGVVQLSDSATTASSTTAATSTAVKSAYDLANAALPKTGGTVTGPLTVSGQLSVSSSIVPTSNLAYDLGTSNARFRDLYLSGNTIDLGGVTIKSTASNDIELAGVNVKTLTQRTRASLGYWMSRSCSDNVWRSICWSPERSIFVAVGNGTSSFVMTSPDGVTWTDQTTPVGSSSWGGVCWSSERLLFVAAANSAMYTSPDGITWTARTISGGSWQSVCWSPELAIFVAVAGNGLSTAFSTSPDGMTWTARTAPTSADNVWSNVCWSPQRSLFVVVGVASSSSNIATSPDGITWTLRTSVSGYNWSTVCWSPEANLFVAVAYTSASNNIVTSSDGINWIQRTTPNSYGRTGICWSAENNSFLSVSTSGGMDRVLSSPDGITWTAHTSPDNNWSSVCWSSDLAIFAAVAGSGTGNRAMTNTVAAPQQASVNVPGIVQLSSSLTSISSTTAATSAALYNAAYYGHAQWSFTQAQGTRSSRTDFFDPFIIASAAGVAPTYSYNFGPMTSSIVSTTVFKPPANALYIVSLAAAHSYNTPIDLLLVDSAGTTIVSTFMNNGSTWQHLTIVAPLMSNTQYRLVPYANAAGGSFIAYSRYFSLTLLKSFT